MNKQRGESYVTMAVENTWMIETTNPEEAQALGEKLAPLLQPDDVILFAGDLGAGKTQFVQGVARGLGVQAQVTSPTFNILLEYHDGRLPLFHFDLYRLDEPEELDDIDFFGVLESDGVSFVEWSEKFPEEMPEEHVSLSLAVRPDETRVLTVCGHGARGVELAAQWKQALEKLNGAVEW